MYIDGLKRLQSRCITTAPGLPLSVHYCALIAALRIPRVHEELRRGVLQGLAGIFRCQSSHRLSQSMTRRQVLLATDQQQLSDSFLGLAYALLNSSFLKILDNVTCHVDIDAIRCIPGPDGVVDTLRFLLNVEKTPITRHLIRLLCA